LTLKETQKLFAILMISYPKFYPAEEKDKLRMTIELWAEMLGDIPFDIVQVAVKKLILENSYPPTIADVRKQIADIMTDPEDRIDASTAWGEVTHAVRMFGWPRPEEALESLSPRTRKVVKQIGWQEICQSTEPGVIRGQFLKMYEAYAARERQDALLPESMKEIIRQIGEQQHQKVLEQKEKIIKGLLEG
jgi:hypothetical protein